MRVNEEIFGGQVGIWQNFQRPEVLFNFYCNCDSHHLITWLQDLRAPNQLPQIKPCASQQCRSQHQLSRINPDFYRSTVLIYSCRKSTPATGFVNSAGNPPRWPEHNAHPQKHVPPLQFLSPAGIAHGVLYGKRILRFSPKGFTITDYISIKNI